MHSRSGRKNVWEQLHAGLDGLTSGGKVTMTRELYVQHYTLVYDECVSHNSENRNTVQVGACFNGGTIYAKLREYLVNYCEKIKVKAEDMNGDNLLTYLNTEWVRFTHASKTIDGMCSYLNRHYVRRSNDNNTGSGTDSIGNSTEDLSSIEPQVAKTCHEMTCEVDTLCMVTWRDIIFKPLSSGIIEATLELIAKERNGEMVDHTLISTVKDCLTNIDYVEDVQSRSSSNSHELPRPSEAPVTIRSLKVYEDYFQKPFLLQTEAYYKAKSSQILADNGITHCMKLFDQFIEDEKKRVNDYLHKSSSEPLNNVCKATLITAHLEHFNTEFVSLLKDEKDDDVSLMYSLLASVDKLDFLAASLQDHIHKYGLEQIEKVQAQALESPEIYSTSVLGVHEKFHGLVCRSFEKNPIFVEALDKACRQFVNKNAVTKAAKKTEKTSELLAKHCDGLLKKSSKVSDEELEAALSRIMTVFVYIEDKHAFQMYYSKYLAKRLVHDNSLSDDAESTMISKLKSACGYEYTGKLQRMFTDVSVSKEHMEAFQSRIKDSSTPLTHDFNAKIITDGSWPITGKNAQPLLFPEQLQKSLDRFETFYVDKHTGRRLNWITLHSKGELKTTYMKRPMVLQCSAVQMAILLSFTSQVDATTVGDLMKVTSATFSIMKANVQLLGKTKLVKVEDKEITESTKVSLHLTFQSKKAKLNINVPIKQEKEAEQKDTEKSISADRELIIQASLVRIMKMRKTMKHKELTNEAMIQLNNRFVPKMSMVKKMIDVLIEKDYLARADGQKDVYNYLA